MIGEFFSISETNIGHVATRAALRPIPQDEPAERSPAGSHPTWGL
ncbi:hypothetical protein ACNPNP_07855 [Microbacterium sp. AGC85]